MITAKFDSILPVFSEISQRENASVRESFDPLSLSKVGIASCPGKASVTDPAFHNAPVLYSLSRPAVIPVNPEVPQGKIRQAGRRLLDSAVATALDNFWTYFWTFIAGAIGPTLMAILVAVILYLRAPESAWVYSLLKYAFVFLAGTLLPMLGLVSLALVGVYRKRRKAKDRVHKYASTEKAWVDYNAELGPVLERFIGLTGEIGRETIQVAARSGELILAIQILDPKRRRSVTSKRAKALNKHCSKMEIASEQLSGARDAFLEVAEGLLKTMPTASEGNGPKLLALEESLVEMNNQALTIIQSQNDLIEKSKAVHGQVSMDVNTSMNWLIAVCQENVRIIEGFKRRMTQKLMPLLQAKLRS